MILDSIAIGIGISSPTVDREKNVSFNINIGVFELESFSRSIDDALRRIFTGGNGCVHFLER